MRVLVCGSRDFIDRSIMFDILLGFTSGMGDDPDMIIIHGAAQGADTIASEVADCFRWTQHRFPADWNRYGRSAGPLRNIEMLQEGKPDRVVAFVNKPLAESKGTAHMVKIARKAGIRTYVVEAL